YRNKLQLNAYSSVSYRHSYDAWNYNINMNLNYDIGYDFLLKFNFENMRYFSFGQSVNVFQAGLVKKFSSHKQGKKHRLTLHLFEDVNGNYRPDKGEKPVTGQLIRIDQDVFRTDQHGKPVYKKLPAGNYRVSI